MGVRTNQGLWVLELRGMNGSYQNRSLVGVSTMFHGWVLEPTKGCGWVLELVSGC